MFAKSLLLAALVASVTAAPLSADPATTTADQTPAEVASGQLSSPLPAPEVSFSLLHQEGGDDSALNPPYRSH